MTPFDQALREEEKWLCKVTERPMPSDSNTGRRVYIGPCLPPVASLHYLTEADATHIPHEDHIET